MQQLGHGTSLVREHEYRRTFDRIVQVSTVVINSELIHRTFDNLYGKTYYYAQYYISIILSRVKVTNPAEFSS